MQIQENISLRPYNTFGMDAKARYFAAFSSADELLGLNDRISGSGNLPVMILGGGSNILLTKDQNGWVLKNEIKGVQLLHEDPDHIYVRAGAGESWHGLVMYCIERNWAGIENLALIPGCVGAAPMQNIGAYGVELKDVFHSLEALDTKKRSVMTFTLSDCTFGYRDSFFKHSEPGRYVILSVTLKLRKQPIFHVSYGAIKEELEKAGVKAYSIKAIADAVIRIRSSKLPDPAVTGNAGSFFKNPSVPATQFEVLNTAFPEISGYPAADGTVKVAAGWLIEHCGPADDISWKGYRVGDAGVHPRQALVLVNYGKANGEAIAALASAIQSSVFLKYNIKLEKEVNFY